MAETAHAVELTRQAEKDLRDLPPGSPERALRAIWELEGNPRKGHALKGSLRGVLALEFTLVDGAYRAVYVVQEDPPVCIVFLVGAHEGIYGKAVRRYRALRRR